MWTVYALVLSFVVLTVLGKLFDHQLNIYLSLVILLMFFIGSFSMAVNQVFFVGDIDGIVYFVRHGHLSSLHRRTGVDPRIV